MGQQCMVVGMYAAATILAYCIIDTRSPCKLTVCILAGHENVVLLLTADFSRQKWSLSASDVFIACNITTLNYW